MIVYATCVGDVERYERVALPSIRAVAADDDLIWTRTGERGIAAAYNEMLLAARQLEDCDFVILLHEDVQILDRNLRAKLLGSLAPDIGIVGVVGASRLSTSEWWASRHTAGFVYETRGVVDYGDRHCDVDVVDGLFLAVTRHAFDHLLFDGNACPAFHGYDVDYCLQARQAGLRVVIRPIDLFHRARGGYGDEAAFYATKAALQAKWVDRFEKPRTPPRVHRAIERGIHIAGVVRRDPRRAGSAVRSRLSHLVERRERTDVTVAPTGHVPRDTSTGSLRCIACGSAVPVPPSDVTDTTIVDCPSCGTGTTWPAPARGAGDTGRSVGRRSGQGPHDRGRREEEARVRLGWVQLHVHHGVILDVGAVPSEFVSVAASAGFEALGTEVSEGTAEAVQDWRRDHAGFRVDCVTLWRVLERAPDPRAVLTQILEVLQPDGSLLLEVPNFGSASAQRQRASWHSAALTDHRHHYTARGLEHLLRSCGLEPVELLELPSTIYLDRNEAAAKRNRTLVDDLDWPDRDLLRVRAEPITRRQP